jgi:hypothetical protein
MFLIRIAIFAWSFDRSNGLILNDIPLLKQRDEIPMRLKWCDASRHTSDSTNLT